MCDIVERLLVLLDDGTRKYVWGLDLAYAVTSSGSLEVFHTDGLGSVRAITDATGAVVHALDTDEFGVATRSEGSLVQPFGFSGEQRDPTSLSYLRARMYDPALGRFLQRDPFAGALTLPLSLNRFSYVHNNPINLVDPMGLAAQSGTSSVLRGEIDCTDRSNWLSRIACPIRDVMTTGSFRMHMPNEVQDVADMLSGVADDIARGRRAANAAGDTPGSSIRQVFKRKTDAPKWPADFVHRSTRQENVKNRQLLAELRTIEPGDWKKIYEDGYANGERVSIHYFRSRSGQVFDLDVKSGWSNP